MQLELDDVAPVSVEISRGMAVCPHAEIRKVFEQPLRQALITRHDLRVDVSKVDTIQTSMLSHLVYASRRLGKQNSKVILVGPSESLVDLLRACRLDKLIQVESKSIADEYAATL